MPAVLAKVNCCVLVGPIEPDKRHAARVEEKLVAIEVNVAAMGANEGLSGDLVGVVAVHSSTKGISRVLENSHSRPFQRGWPGELWRNYTRRAEVAFSWQLMRRTVRLFKIGWI